jgi:hypothetical protein
MTTSPLLSFKISDAQASGSVPAKPNQSAGKQLGQAEAGGQLDGIKVPTPWASGKRDAVQKKE